MKKTLFSLLLLLMVSSGKMLAQCFANFSYTNVGNTYTFTDQSMDSSGTIVSYSWDFGDSNTASTSSVVHTFGTGVYNMCLAIQTSTACRDTMCITINTQPVTPTVNAFLMVDSMQTYACIAPASVMFYYSGYLTGYGSNDSALVSINFGDGVDSTYYEHNIMQFGAQITHMYLNAGTYTPQIVITAPDLLADTFVSQSVFVGATCGNISGTVYLDNNNNCIFDAGDVLSANSAVYISSGSAFVGYATTDGNGVYSFNVPSGPTYEISVPSNSGINNHYAVTCPVSGSVSITTIPSTGNDFGLSCPPGYDLQGSIYSWGLRPGFTSYVCVSAYNERCTTPSGQIEVIVDPLLTPLPDTSGSYAVIGNTVTYLIDSTNSYWSFCILVSVPQNAQIGDSVCFTMNITPSSGDANPADNTFEYCSRIVGSFDPNDKAVSPAGVGSTGLVTPTTDLTYTIRFQNTGTAEAFNIYILDSLSENVDPSSIQILGTSHPMTFSILAGNILRFTYDNINLPDSNANERESHGYVAYRISQSPNVLQGATINNTAAIYFDFNDPVITNTTVNTVDYFLSVNGIENRNEQFSMYPNPSNDRCLIAFADNSERTITISDAIGKQVFFKKISGNNYSLNTEQFSTGIYSVQISGANKTNSTSKLVISR